MLFLIAGLPGTGKTTIARAFAQRIGAIHLSSDALRQELGLMGHYTPEDKAKVYNEMLERVRISLNEGRTVVVDSTFYKASVRQPFAALAASYGIPVKWVEIKAKETTLRNRLNRTRPDSEANFEVYEKIRDQFEPLPEDRLVIWSDEMSPDMAAAEIAAVL